MALSFDYDQQECDEFLWHLTETVRGVARLERFKGRDYGIEYRRQLAAIIPALVATLDRADDADLPARAV